jgi:pantetheine-phosphate adenylyltransferase
MRKAVFMGSFDPITLGHLDLIQRSLQMFDVLVVAVGVNPDKKTWFSEEERLVQIEKALSEIMDFGLHISSYQGLTVDYANSIGAKFLIRGLRSVADFEFETNLASFNKMLAPDLETVLLLSKPELSLVSSSAVKELARYGKDLSHFLPSCLIQEIMDRFGFIRTGLK